MKGNKIQIFENDIQTKGTCQQSLKQYHLLSNLHYVAIVYFSLMVFQYYDCGLMLPSGSAFCRPVGSKKIF